MERNKLLVVYNTCGISGRDNTDYYIKAIRSILSQDFKDCRVVISSCMNSVPQREKLESAFGDTVSYCYIEDLVPVNISFNKAVRDSVKEFGKFDGYLYLDSGLIFQKETDLTSLYDLYKSGPYAMASARTTTDTGMLAWFDVEDEEGFESDLVIPVGKALNLHAQIFSPDLLEAYDNLIPDIFASYCTESTFSFLCAAINKKWVVSKDIVLDHAWSMDGASSGFNPNGMIERYMPAWQHLFGGPRSMVEIIEDPEGISSGFGYEEINDVMHHDPSQFDEEGYCKNTRLKDFIKKNIFLSSEHFDYEEMTSSYIKNE
jgi:hypothetical protein